MEDGFTRALARLRAGAHKGMGMTAVRSMRVLRPTRGRRGSHGIANELTVAKLGASAVTIKAQGPRGSALASAPLSVIVQ